jgi:uncharacterized repeat protein (TIGR04076 family)
MTMQPCDIVTSGAPAERVTVLPVKGRRCRYHRPSPQETAGRLFPPGVCPLAYLSAYPGLFALHARQTRFRAPPAQELEPKTCPAGDRGVTFRVSSAPLPFRWTAAAVNFASSMLNLFIPWEIHSKATAAEVVSVGACPLGLRPGQTFAFNVNSREEICPAAANSIYPMLDDDAACALACPDYRTRICYRAREPGDAVAPAARFDCDDYGQRVRVESLTGSCFCPLENGRWYDVGELLVTLGIPCFTSYHVAFPYLYALARGGQLGYLRRSREEAGIGCPNATVGVRYVVFRKRGAYGYRCLRSGPSCPRRVADGSLVRLPEFERGLAFYAALNELYAVARKLTALKAWRARAAAFNVYSREGGSGLTWRVEQAGAAGG